MIKVALIAVAKDEDTYIHEWIHHHLFLGFSPILIGVNRTSDQTLEIINKISATDKRVQAFCIDWIDQTGPGLNTRIQNIGYAYLCTKIDTELINYVGFLDIDEYWFNTDKKKVQNFIALMKPFDIASFFWVCQLGEELEFTPPFVNVNYKSSGFVKSIIKTKLLNKIKIYSYHVPIFKEKHYVNLIHIDQLGNNISSLNNTKSHNVQMPTIDRSVISTCILHRMMRSEKEYLSLVLRGRPNGEIIKSNERKGFKKAKELLPEVYNNGYYQSLKQFIKTHNLSKILDKRKIKKLSSFKNKISRLNTDQLKAERKNAIDALNNTTGLKYFVDEYINKITDINSLKDFALELEKIDLSLAFSLMNKALKLNPSEQLIKHKTDEYHDRLNELKGKYKQ